MLAMAHAIHTLRHQRVGIHVAGNSLADEATKATVFTAAVAAITRSSTRIDRDIIVAEKLSIQVILKARSTKHTA